VCQPQERLFITIVVGSHSIEEFGRIRRKTDLHEGGDLVESFPYDSLVRKSRVPQPFGS